MSVFSQVVRFREPGWSHVQEEIASLRKDFDLDRFLACFAWVKKCLEIETPDALGALSEAISIDLRSWSADEMGRAHFLLSFADFPEERFRDIVEKCYRYGDNREQIAVLKALSLFPHREAFLPIALSACRSNVIPVFAALALNNPYPAAVFAAHAFDNLVLKAIFVGLPLPAIVGLSERKNRELAQMVEDWIDEREAANRPVIPEIWPLVCPFAGESRLARAYRYLAGADVGHRRAVALALGQTANPRHLPHLAERLKSETQTEVKTAIEDAISSIEAMTGREKK